MHDVDDVVVYNETRTAVGPVLLDIRSSTTTVHSYPV